ncbi:hypothetical protein [Chlamydia sp. 17-3921]|nr:hypothetical protein [Chlamydia sp. 17-3921]
MVEKKTKFYDLCVMKNKALYWNLCDSLFSLSFRHSGRYLHP